MLIVGGTGNRWIVVIPSIPRCLMSLGFCHSSATTTSLVHTQSHTTIDVCSKLCFTVYLSICIIVVFVDILLLFNNSNSLPAYNIVIPHKHNSGCTCSHDCCYCCTALWYEIDNDLSTPWIDPYRSTLSQILTKHKHTRSQFIIIDRSVTTGNCQALGLSIWIIIIIIKRQFLVIYVL